MIRKLIFFGLFLVLSVSAWLAQGTRPTLSTLITIASDCQNKKNDTVNYPCVRRQIASRIVGGNIDGLLAEMKQQFPKGPDGIDDTSRCTSTNSVLRHSVLHVVGEVAIKNHFPMRAIYSACENACDFGCFHGAFMGILRQDAKLLEQPGNFCNELEKTIPSGDMRSCYHVMGHGVAEYYGKDLNRTLAVCSSMPQENFQRDCFDGVLMENLGILSVTHTPPQLTPSVFIGLCEGFTDPYKGLCYERIGTFAHYLFDDKMLAMTVCEKVPKEYQIACTQKLGNRLFYLSIPDMAGFVASCKPLSMPLYGECIATGLRILRTKNDGRAQEQTVCRLVKQEYTKECYANIQAH